jgi:hypothetical protein
VIWVKSESEYFSIQGWTRIYRFARRAQNSVGLIAPGRLIRVVVITGHRVGAPAATECWRSPSPDLIFGDGTAIDFKPVI